jgi:hypothetical protein
MLFHHVLSYFKILHKLISPRKWYYVGVQLVNTTNRHELFIRFKTNSFIFGS